jgi:type IV pilus assembly protein PilM
MSHLFRRKYWTGLDIGTSSVKIVHIRDDKDFTFSYHIRSIQFSDQDNPTSEQLKDVLKDLNVLEKNRFGDAVAAGVKGHSILTRYIEIPQISARDLETAVPIESKKFFPYLPEGTAISHSVIPPLSDDPNKQGVTFIQSPEYATGSIIKLLKDFSIKSLYFDYTAFALARAYKSTSLYLKGETVMMLDIGSRYTTVSIIKNGWVYFARTFAVGGRDFTKNLVNDEAETYSKAEFMKMTIDLFDDNRHFHFIQPVLEDWLFEILDCMDYFCNQLADEPQKINRVILCGGGALLKKLPTFMEKHLKTPVVVFRHFPGKCTGVCNEVDLTRGVPMFACAWGYALRALREKP